MQPAPPPPRQQAPPPKPPPLARSACPICGAPFPAAALNADVNAHIDACLRDMEDCESPQELEGGERE